MRRPCGISDIILLLSFFVDEKRFIMTKMAMMTLMVMVDDYVL